MERNRADAILLSGGLDSSILASILRPEFSITVALGSDAPDLFFARQVADKYARKHVEVIFDYNKMLDLVDQIVQIFRTFDPIEIRNSAVALAGIQQARDHGHSALMTGDGADELFAGYNYLTRYYGQPDKLDSELQRLWQLMHFSSKELGANVGMEVKTPFLDEEFAAFAKSLGVRQKVGEHGGQKWGKYILRHCYEPDLGSQIAWRPKLAQELGAATDRFQDYIDARIDDLTFANKLKIAQQEGVKLRSKEHLHYYSIFRSYFAPPREDGKCELRCPDCMACFNAAGRFCRTCGSYPVIPVGSS